MSWSSFGHFDKTSKNDKNLENEKFVEIWILKHVIFWNKSQIKIIHNNGFFDEKQSYLMIIAFFDESFVALGLKFN